jgi:protoheme IX farnesyltransferase
MRLRRSRGDLTVTPTLQASSNLIPVNPEDAILTSVPVVESAAVKPLTSPAREPGDIATRIADYRELFKMRVTTMVVITAWAGFYLGSMKSGISSMQTGLIETLVGIGIVSAGSSALNQALERKSDAKMLRTADRPLPSGRIGLAHGIILGLLAIAAGSIWLSLRANLLTGTLTLITAFSYVAIYTPLKRHTTLATFIGAFPGAMPPLIGWVAARGVIEWPAVALFAILFVWQFPHFMAIDYGRAGIRMLPVVQPDGWSTAVEALVYAVLMIPVSLLPVYLHTAGNYYGAAALLLGIFYLIYTVRFSRIIKAQSVVESRRYARDLLKVSVIYLPLLLTAMMLNATGK